MRRGPWPPTEQLSFEEVDSIIDETVEFYESPTVVMDGVMHYDAVRHYAYPVDNNGRPQPRGSCGRTLLQIFPDTGGSEFRKYNYEEMSEEDLDLWIKYNMIR